MFTTIRLKNMLKRWWNDCSFRFCRW